MLDFMAGISFTILLSASGYFLGIKYRDNYRKNTSSNLDRWVIAALVFMIVAVIQIIIKGILNPDVAPSEGGMSFLPSIGAAILFYYYSGPKAGQANAQIQRSSAQDYPPAAPSIRPNEDERDPYMIAGEELLSGSVEPTAWARALVDGEEQGDAFKARYIRERVKAIQQERRRWEAAIKKEKKDIADIATNLSVIQDEISQFASLRGVSEIEAKIMAAYMIYKAASGFIVYTNSIKEFRSFPSVWSAALFASRVQPPVSQNYMPYRFKEIDLTVYGKADLEHLQKTINNNDPSLGKIRDRLCKKIGWDSWNARGWNIKGFLQEYYRQLRESLEILPR